MDQFKEYLNLALKYRFWIAVGIAALLPIAGYFAAAGAIETEKTTLENTVKSNFTAVGKYASNSRPVNDKYEPLVAAENTIIKGDINTAWRKLYALQAPYLTWPTEVEDTIPVWAEKYGRDKWPEDLERILVDQAIFAYVESYDPYVTEVYNVLKPFDPATGKGIVVAPPRDYLLAPPKFQIGKLPSLGKVWTTQEKLWIQRTVLEVIAAVNEKAKADSWQSAPVKQLLVLDVATDSALDQKSIAEGVTLTDAPDILPPGSDVAPKAEASTNQLSQGGKFGSFEGGGGGGVAAAKSDPGVVKYVTNTTNGEQLSIAPIYLSVYCQQDAIPNLLVEFKNSPMNIQVLEVSIVDPPPHVVRKPKKGDVIAGSSMGMGGGMGGRLGGMLEGNYGGSGMQDMMKNMMGGPGTGSAGYGQGDTSSMMRGRQGMAGGYSSPSVGGRNAGRGGNSASVETKRQGVDVRNKSTAQKKAELDKAKQKEASEGEEEEEPVSKVSDPYYDVVEVRIYGQARFYKTPPKEEVSTTDALAQPTDGSGEPAAETPGVAGTTEAKPADADAEAEKSEAQGAEKPQSEDVTTPETEQPKTEPAKGEKGESAEKSEPAKPDAKPADGETQPADAPKGEDAEKEESGSKPPADDSEK
jgi:hypothetical protein